MLTLVIGNKNTSSWSLRPWIALTHHKIPFEEAHVRLRRPDTRDQCLAHSPSGKIPVLKDGDLLIWDSLAILEYLADSFPDLQLWPADGHTRARARSVSAEMHAGFPDLRRDMPMDIVNNHDMPDLTEGLDRDIRRVIEIWEDCLETASGGPFLFGAFNIADAMFAPVVTRFLTYGTKVPDSVKGYMDSVMALPAMQSWIKGAHREEKTNQG